MDAIGHPRPHFVLVPLMAHGHMIPMVDMAYLLADRGSLVSFITTPVNAARIKSTIDRVKDSRLPIRFIELPFHCSEAGLPEGCENADLIESLSFLKPFFEGTHILKEPLELYLREQRHDPICMISDFCLPWTAELARKLNIPRLVFHGPSCLYLLSVHNIQKHRISDRITNQFEPFLVPDLPQQWPIVVTRVQSLGFFESPEWEEFQEKILESEAAAEGVVMNSSEELEDCFIENYQKVMGKNVWTIGPLCLHNQDNSYKATRGNKAVVDQHRVLNWLDSMSRDSVIYISFGSLARKRDSQMIEIGLGLEASNRPFIWVIKESENSPEVNKWLSGGFEERTRERGFVIKGWAPQLMILSHPAIGGFLTHCGWNSMLESVSVGVPVITWPHFSDQFLNEKLMVDVLRVGVSIGVTIPTYHLRPEDSEERLVTKEEVEKAVASLMDEKEEAKERRQRAKVFGMKAKEAMEEGGSSYKNLTHLIQYVLGHQNNNLEE
uniref:Glycosyltransferase n=1 Tax=Paris polyphylla var. yunnanensis TaxID=221260 RepID=A0A9Y1L8F8_PARPY|nr:sterol glycosyltransferases [Paris polyphylla var. yunnanensis]